MEFFDEDFDRVSHLTTFAIDTETDSKYARKATLKCFVIATDRFAVRFAASSLPRVAPLLKKAKLLYLQNFKYDYLVLKRHGCDIDHVPFRDTMLLHHLIDENAEHGLDAMVQHYYGDNYKEEFWGKYETFEQAPDAEGRDYVCKDGIYTTKLAEKFLARLSRQGGLVEHVHRLALSLYKTEVEGVRLDVPAILDYAPKAQEQIIAAKAAIRPAVEAECQEWEMSAWLKEINKRVKPDARARVEKPTFNWASAPQKQWLLYDKLGLPVVARTKAGKPAIDYEALLKLKGKHPVIDRLLDYSGLETNYNTFVLGLLERQEEGRIYPDFNVNGTLTGRISSSNPNLQNMPKEGVYRGFFIPSDGCVFFGADYSQLEVVIEANLSGDANLKKIVLEGASKHDITNDELKLGSRDLAKTLNFAAQYHCSVHKFAELLKCSKEEAQYIYDKYWETYKGVKALKEYTDSLVDSGKPIVSPFGRERHFPSSFESERDKGRAYRQAYNALIQGTGADCTHTAFHRRARQVKCGRLLWPIHDEILGETTPENNDREKEGLVQTMCAVGDEIGFKIPLSAKAYGALIKWAKT